MGGLEAMMAAQEACYGKKCCFLFIVMIKLNLIVSLGYDFLSDSPNGIEVNRQFADARRYKKRWHHGPFGHVRTNHVCCWCNWR